MLSFEIRSPLHRHSTATIIIGGSDFFLCESQRFQHVEIGFIQLRIGQPQLLTAKILTQRIFVERKLNLEGLSQTAFHSCKGRIVEPLPPQGLMVNEWCGLQGLPANAIVHDVLNLRLGISQGVECRWHTLIDDLEIASAGQFFEFDQRKIRFDACGIAIHHKSDRARRSNHRDLRIAVPVGRPQLKRTVPCTTRRHKQRGRAMLRLDSYWCHRQTFIFFRSSIVRGSPMITDDTQHGLAVFGIARERRQFCGHFR